MLTLPKPLPDELLCSALARATYRYGFWSPKQLLDILYGRRTVGAVPDLPCNLASLVQAIGSYWELDIEKLATQHTLFRYYTHFRAQQERKDVLAAMAHSGGSLHLRLGICAGSARAPRRFHLCPQCHADDIARFGEAYWHRAHHLPGVLVCNLHGDYLRESNVPFHTPARNVYEPAPIEIDWNCLPPLVSSCVRRDMAHAVATHSVEVLEAEHCAPSQITDYRPELRLRGWRPGPGEYARLRDASEACFGKELLTCTFSRSDCHPLDWLAEVIQHPHRRMHPLKHVLMRVFLASQVLQTKQETEQKIFNHWDVPALQQEAANLYPLELETRVVAEVLNADQQTTQRLRTPFPPRNLGTSRSPDIDRRAWEVHAASHPSLGKSELRLSAVALYARLYRNDHAWLMDWSSPPKRSEKSVRRINWPQRDENYEAQVLAQITKTLQETPPRRASRGFILGTLGLRSTLGNRGFLLPRTQAALDRACESVSAYQLRRLIRILGQEGMATAPEWRVWYMAGIEPSRFADGGRGLMQLAREGRQNGC